MESVLGELTRESRCYVYELRDSENNEVFYIGKGTGERARQHIIEALKDDSNSEKLQRIREIHSRQAEVNIVVIGRYETEEEAYAVETTLIKWVYGLTNLTNIVQGHRHRSVRPFGVFSEVNGIDIPRKKYAVSGAYKQGIIDQVRDNYVLEDLEELRTKIIERIKNIDISMPDILSAQAPCILITYNSNVRIQIILSRTGNQMVVMNLVPCEWTKKGRTIFKTVCKCLGTEAKSDGKYAKPQEWRNQIRLKDIDTIVDRLHMIKREFVAVGEESNY